MTSIEPCRQAKNIMKGIIPDFLSVASTEDLRYWWMQIKVSPHEMFSLSGDPIKRVGSL